MPSLVPAPEPIPHYQIKQIRAGLLQHPLPYFLLYTKQASHCLHHQHNRHPPNMPQPTRMAVLSAAISACPSLMAMAEQDSESPPSMLLQPRSAASSSRATVSSSIALCSTSIRCNPHTYGYL
jgi:hypothetical protein